jgi:hypothetical protein
MTIAFRDADVGPMFKDMGVPVIINGTPGLGLVDENDQIVVSNNGRGEVVGGVHTVRVQASKFPPIKNGMQIIVDGLSYSIRQKLTEQGDAAIVKFVLGDASGITEVIVDGGTF